MKTNQKGNIWRRATGKIRYLSDRLFAYRKAIMFDKMVVRYDMSPSDRLSIHVASEEDVKNEEYKDIWNSKEEALAELKKGNILFLVKDKGANILYGWAELRSASIPYLGVHDMAIPEEIVYMSGLYVPPEYRGRFLTVRATKLMQNFLLDNTKAKKMFYVLSPDNYVFKNGLELYGNRPYQHVTYVKMFGFRVYIVRPLRGDLSSRPEVFFNSCKFWDRYSDILGSEIPYENSDRRGRIKIAFVGSNDILDKNSLSGSAYLCAKLLEKHCGEVDYIHNFRPNKITVKYLITNVFNIFTWIYILQKSKEIFWKVLGRSFVWEKTPLVSKYYGRMIGRRLKGKDYDLIFSDKGSFCIAYLDTKVPIIYQTDATFKAMENYYPEFMNPSKGFAHGGNDVEKRALEKASLVITTSKWAADSMSKDYGVSKDKISIVPRTAVIRQTLAREAILQEKGRDMCRLLFVGVDWARKGGDIAVETVDWLNREGIRSRLIVCGCTPPKKYSFNPYIEAAGFLDKKTLEGKSKMEELFLSAHFFILPTRAECLAQVFCEASAYGLPILAANTGGIPSIVKDGRNGFLLGLSSRGLDYGMMVKQLWSDDGRYQALRRDTRQMFEDELSSAVWEQSMVKAIKSVIPKIEERHFCK